MKQETKDQILMETVHEGLVDGANPEQIKGAFDAIAELGKMDCFPRTRAAISLSFCKDFPELAQIVLRGLV